MVILSNLLFGYAINLLVTLVIVRFIYFPLKQSKNYVFTFIAFNTIIFFVMGLFGRTEIGIGTGFGLFAVFSVLRYRTNPMPTREITYLFILIGLAIINSSLLNLLDWDATLLINLLIALVLFVLEKEWGFYYERSQRVQYERIELIKPRNHEALLADLRERTGLNIKRAEVTRIDFLRDTANITVYYDDAAESSWNSEDMMGEGDDSD